MKKLIQLYGGPKVPERAHPSRERLREIARQKQLAGRGGTRGKLKAAKIDPQDRLGFISVGGRQREPRRVFEQGRGYVNDMDLETVLNLPMIDTLFSIYGQPRAIKIGEGPSGAPAGYHPTWDIMRVSPGDWAGGYFFETLAHELAHRGQAGGAGHPKAAFRHSPSGAHTEGMADATAFAHSLIRDLGRKYTYGVEPGEIGNAIDRIGAKWPKTLEEYGETDGRYAYTGSDILKQALYLLDMPIYKEHPLKTNQEDYNQLYDAYKKSLQDLDQNKNR